MELESPRAKLCQALIEDLQMQHGRILIIAKDGRFLRIEPTPIVNANELDVLEAVQCGPAPADS